MGENEPRARTTVVHLGRAPHAPALGLRLALARSHRLSEGGRVGEAHTVREAHEGRSWLRVIGRANTDGRAFAGNGWHQHSQPHEHNTDAACEDASLPPPGRSKAAESATSDAASSSSPSNGWAPNGSCLTLGVPSRPEFLGAPKVGTGADPRHC